MSKICPESCTQIAHTCSCGLEDTERLEEVQESLHARRLGRQLNDYAVLGYVHDLRAELFGQHSDRVEVLMLETQSLGRSEDGLGVGSGPTLEVVGKGGLTLELGMLTSRLVERTTGQLVVDIFGPKDGDLGEEQFTLNHACFGIIKDGPYGYL